MFERENYNFQAKLARQACRYDEMAEAMKRIASMHVELELEERNLLLVAYKNVIGTRRAAWRIMNSIEQKEMDQNGSATRQNLKMIRLYRGQIEEECRDICMDILSVLEKHLIPCATTSEDKVFYYKMKGDYCRYLAEFSNENHRNVSVKKGLLAYKKAHQIAKSELSPTNIVRLGLALNFSVFYYEIINSPNHAIQLAKAAFDDAMANLNTFNQETMLFLRALKSNKNLWNGKQFIGSIIDMD